MHASRNIIRVIKSRKMRVARHVGCMGELRNAYDFLSENLKGRDDTEDLGEDGRIM
jgi:hypothetical protein